MWVKSLKQHWVWPQEAWNIYWFSSLSSIQEILEAREKVKLHIWTFRTPEEASAHWNRLFGHLEKNKWIKKISFHSSSYSFSPPFMMGWFGWLIIPLIRRNRPISLVSVLTSNCFLDSSKRHENFFSQRIGIYRRNFSGVLLSRALWRII